MLEIQLHIWVFKLHMVMMLRPETYYMYYYYLVLGNENQGRTLLSLRKVENTVI